MKAVHLNYDKTFKIIEVPKPFPSKGEVLVQVKYAAIDTATRQVLNKDWVGYLAHARTEPLILGWHFSGAVVEKDPEVDDYQVGNAVWGHLQYQPGQQQGSYAEYITVAVDACARQPENVSLEQCAAAATETMTALQAMRDVGGLEEDMHVLIVGAGGGVGSAAVGIAKKLGATVTAVCSSKDVARVQALGADRVVDRSKDEDPLANDSKVYYHVIFDTPSVYSAPRCLSHLYHGGAYVSTLPSWHWLGGMIMSQFTSKKVAVVEVKSKKDDLELIGEWLQQGLVDCNKIDSQFKIKDMDKALARHEDRPAGRVVLQVEGGWA